MDEYLEFSNNSYVQAICHNTYVQCNNDGIKFDATINIPEGLSLENIELCRLFSNLLNNAMEACNKFNGKDKIIKVVTSIESSWISIKIINSFNGIVNSEDKTLYTTKSDKVNNGLGMKIINESLEKHGGFMNCKWDDKFFNITVHLPIAN